MPPFFERREYAVFFWNPSDSSAQGTVDARQKKRTPLDVHADHAIHRLKGLGSRRRAQRKKKTPPDEPRMTAYFEDFPLRAGPRVVV
jgi:hypothetical protein